MKRQVHARKRRQLKSLAKQLHHLSIAGRQRDKFLALRSKIISLLTELRTFFSSRSLVRMLGKSAVLLGIGLSTSGLLAQQFTGPVESPFGLLERDIHSILTPSFGDLDGDGDLDLIITADTNASDDEYEYNFVYYENIGTATEPEYDTEQVSPFGLPIAELGILNVNPSLGDIDGDGDLDVMVCLVVQNSYDPQTFQYLENIGTPTAPSFADPVASPIEIETVWLYNDLVDMDSDGDLDILIGSYDDEYSPLVFYVENSGDAQNAMFEPAVNLDLVTDFPLYWFSMITTGDLDNDGDLDILIGSYTYIEKAPDGQQDGSVFTFFENRGDNSFDPGELKPFGTELNTAIYINSPTLVDIDADGDLDIVTSAYIDITEDYFTQFLFYENVDGEVSGIEVENTLGLTLFPNPAKDVLTIQADEQIQQIEIVDLTGKVHKVIQQVENNISLTNLPPGMYLMKARGLSGAISVKKFEKR